MGSPRFLLVVAGLATVVALLLAAALHADAPHDPGMTPTMRQVQETYGWRPVWKKAAPFAEEPLEARFERLKPLHAVKRAPHSGDWLAEFDQEGQRFSEYVESGPVRPTPQRRTIVLQPVGAFDEAQQQVLARTAQYVERFYQLPVRLLSALPERAIPVEARRQHPDTGEEQIHTRWVLDELLVPRRPPDALAFVAFTATDLFPAENWNFVFGEASLEDRVGVWSLARLGVPSRSKAAFHRCLDRTMKIAVHELGHILGLHHCTAFECVMNGNNSLPESDRSSHRLCPVCLQKLAWNTGLDPHARAAALREFFAEHGFPLETQALAEEEALLAGP